ncbi:MAG: hypothetical protein Kow0013_10450 [Pararhodobacter sp.]
MPATPDGQARREGSRRVSFNLRAGESGQGCRIIGKVPALTFESPAPRAGPGFVKHKKVTEA